MNDSTLSRPRMHSDCMREISVLESRQQRATRVLLLDPQDTMARDTLSSIEAQIEALRQEMRDISAAMLTDSCERAP